MSATIDTAALASIDAATRELHLPGIRDHADRLAAQAQRIAAVIDRVTFKAHIIETGTESYGHRTSPRSRRES